MMKLTDNLYPICIYSNLSRKRKLNLIVSGFVYASYKMFDFVNKGEMPSHKPSDTSCRSKTIINIKNAHKIGGKRNVLNDSYVS